MGLFLFVFRSSLCRQWRKWKRSSDGIHLRCSSSIVRPIDRHVETKRSKSSLSLFVSFGSIVFFFFHLKNFGEPHDLALNVNGRSLFVGEIHPNRIDTFDVLN